MGRFWHTGAVLVAEKVELSTDEATVVDAQLRRWFRRGLLVFLGGVTLLIACIAAALVVEERADPLARTGKAYTAEIKEVKALLPTPAGAAMLVKVRFTRDGRWDQVSWVEVDNPPSIPTVGSRVTILVDRNDQSRITIRGATRPSKVLSLPVAALFALSVLVLGVGGLDFMAAWRIRRHLRGRPWSKWAWEGVVHAPGRGRVRVAGVLTNPVTNEQFLMVNSPGSWREGLEALAGPAEISVAGDPPGMIVARHPSTLRPVLLRAPRSNKSQRGAFRLLELDPP